MALITTNVTLGWYGVHGAEPCQDLVLPELFGSYTSNGTFVKGSSGYNEDEVNLLLMIWTIDEGGTVRVWNLLMEKVFGNDSTNNPVRSLKCGQMYWIQWYGNGDVNIPNFVPTALNVDMGRVTA